MNANYHKLIILCFVQWSVRDFSEKDRLVFIFNVIKVFGNLIRLKMTYQEY